jgi:hypothetical protein
MIQEQFHAIWQNGILLTIIKNFVALEEEAISFYRRLRALNFPFKDYKLEVVYQF